MSTKVDCFVNHPTTRCFTLFLKRAEMQPSGTDQWCWTSMLLLPGQKMKALFLRWSSVSIWTHSMPPDVSLLGGRWSATHVSNVPLHVMCNSSSFFLPERLPTINSYCVASKNQISHWQWFIYLLKKKGWRRTKHWINIVYHQWRWTMVACEFWTGRSDIEIDLLTSESWFLMPVNSFTNLLLLLLTS